MARHPMPEGDVPYEHVARVARDSSARRYPSLVVVLGGGGGVLDEDARDRWTLRRPEREHLVVERLPAGVGGGESARD